MVNRRELAEVVFVLAEAANRRGRHYAVLSLDAKCFNRRAVPAGECEVRSGTVMVGVVVSTVFFVILV